MISVGNNKAVICKGDFHPAQLYKGDKKIAGYTVEEFEGTGGVVLENCYNDKVYNAYVHGKNLLDVNKWFSKYVNGEGGITYKETDLANINYNCRVEYSYWKENTSYTFSCDYEITNADNNSIYATFTYTDGTTDTRWACFGGTTTGNKSGKCTITSYSWRTVKSLHLSYSTSMKTISVKLTNMMLVEGATAKEYEPPCRNATITARGKNILDMSKQTVSQGYYNDTSGSLNTSNKNFTALYPFKVEPNTTYTITSNMALYTMWFSKSYSTSSVDTIKKLDRPKTFTTTEDCEYIKVSLEGRLSNFKWVMLEKGKGDGVYEPYREPQTIPFENGEHTKDIPTFKGTTVIEVESDVPATISGKYKKVEV